MEHEVKIGIEAESKSKAIEVAQALIDIRKALTDTELFELRRVLKEKPGIIKTVKKFFG